MKVVLYHPWIYLKSGLERTILEIARRSRHEIIIYTSHYDAEKTYPELKAFNIREVNPVSVNRDYGSVLKAGKNIAMTRLDVQDVDAVVVCCDGLGTFLSIRNNEKPLFNLCFTPLRAVYDLEYRARHYEKHRNKKWLAWFLEQGFKFVDRLLWRRYDHIVSISETVTKRIEAAGLSSREKISLCYPGIDERKIRPSDVQNKYFFIPGRIMWTKNIELGVMAFKKFKASVDTDFKLIIAGMVDVKSEAYLDELRSIAEPCKDIEFVIEPDDDEMFQLYQNCYGTLFTAFNEDLGLTPMEAMAQAKPVIAVNRGGPTEVVVHNETGLLVNADENSFSVAIQLLASDPELAKKFGKAGLERVKNYTWQAFVDQFDDVIDSKMQM